jgi:chromosome segregation ATPase
LRSLIIEHPIRNDWKLAADLKPAEQSATTYRFRVEVPSKETKTFAVEESHPTTVQYQLSNLNPDLIQVFTSNRELTPGIESALRQILARKDAIAALKANLASRQSDLNRIFQDQERLRENMKVLKGTREEKALTTQYTRQLVEQEQRLGALRTEIAALDAQVKAAQQELDKTIETLAFEADL